MKIQSISPPITEIPFLNSGKRAGGFYVDQLPVHVAAVDDLPEDVAAIIATADLQGRELFENANGRPIRLLGEVLPQRLANEVLPNLSLPAGRIGVILAGDFYTVPGLDKRGGTGDVTEVWNAFGRQFDWVVGVAGNHDQFSGSPTPRRRPSNTTFLNGNSTRIDGIGFGGVSGIIGNPRRHWRHTTDQYCEQVGQAMQSQPDILVLHDGPNHPQGNGKGSPLVRELVESFSPTLVVRGHAHWKNPLAELHNQTQVLNVDARCVILINRNAVNADQQIN